MQVKSIADIFGFDPDSLERWLSRIKGQYKKRHEGYKSYLSQTEVNDLINDTKIRAKELARSLNSMPMDVKELLNSSCSQQMIADDENFLDNLIIGLKIIESITSKTRVHTIGQNKMHHKDWLVRELRKSWEDLAGSPPSKSSAKNLFIDFIELACQHMEIDKKGLTRRHFNID